MRYIAVDRDVLRPLLFDDASLADLLLSTFMRRREALQAASRASVSRSIGPRLVGPDAADSWTAAQAQPPARTAGAIPNMPTTPRPRRSSQALDPDRLPLVRLPGGEDLLASQSTGSSRGRWGSASSSSRAKRSISWSIGGGPAGARCVRLRRLRGTRHPVVESTALGGQAGHLAADRELPWLPGRHHRLGAHQPRDHPGTQVRRAHRDPLPRARARAGRRPARRAPRRRPRGRGPRRACWPPAPSTAACRWRDLRRIRGPERLLCRRAARSPALRRHARGRHRRRQLSRRRPRSGWRAAGRS